MQLRASLRILLLVALACAGFSLARRDTTPLTLSPITPSVSAGIRSQFAVADFDGDRKPDLATVDIQQSGSLATRYSIRLRLTSGSADSIGVTAPFGGLQIVPRDVNGDDALDLVVSSTYRSGPVAVLLNDGHGHFTPAIPSDYPVSEWSPSQQLSPMAHFVRDASVLLVRGPSDGEHGGFLCPRIHLQKAFMSVVCNAPISRPRSFRSGRAPPVSISKA